MLTPSFHFKILEQFTGVFNRNGDILISRLSSHVDGPQFDISSYIAMCTLDVVCGKLLSCRLYAIWRTLLYTAHALGCITELYVTHQRQLHPLLCLLYVIQRPDLTLILLTWRIWSAHNNA